METPLSLKPTMELLAPNSTLLPSDQSTADNTATFAVGFGVLLLFVTAGVLASAFLCLTLKRDQYLWENDREAHILERNDCPDAKQDQLADERIIDCTQI